MWAGLASVSLDGMARKLEVDVAGLFQGSSDVGHRAQVLAAAHRQSLAAMAAKWQRISSRHGRAIENRAVQMDTAAKLFADTEERHTQQLKAVGEQARNL